MRRADVGYRARRRAADQGAADQGEVRYFAVLRDTGVGLPERIDFHGGGDVGEDMRALWRPWHVEARRSNANSLRITLYAAALLICAIRPYRYMAYFRS